MGDSMRVSWSKEVSGLGDKIKEARKKTNRRMTPLCAEAGISVPHWYKIESEKVRELPIETLRGIEKALGVDLGIKLE